MRGRLGVACLTLAACLALLLVTPEAQQPVDTPFVPDELIVKFRPGFSDFQRNGILASRGAGLVRRLRAEVDHVRLPPGQSVRAALDAFRRLPSVVAVQPNFIRRTVASAPPNDPYWLFGYLWGLEKIGAQPAWTSFTHGASDVVVAGIDTGVNYNHPDLAANMWVNPGEIAGNGIDDDGNGYVDDVHGIDTINGDSDPLDDQGHGTHTGGTIAASGNNGIGVVGLAWGARILACKFVDATGSGTDSGAIECFNYIVDLKQRGVNVRVSSNSWGGPRGTEPATVLQGAIDAAGEAGILNVFAAGNNGTNNDVTPFDPAGFDSPSIVSVAASNGSDQRPLFSNYGANSVDLAAPGDFILSTYGGDYGFASGTSMAAPHVAGAAALVVSQEPALTVDATKTLLLQTVDMLPQWAGVVASGGRLNVLSAVTGAGGNLRPSVAITKPASNSSYPMSTAISLEAKATDIDGFVTRVDFYANGVLVGTDPTGTADVFDASWTPTVAGNYSLSAVATDDAGETRTSNAVAISMIPPAGRLNVALAANGGVASASSTYASGYPPHSVINGDRKGVGWGNGGGWADGTTGAWPDWLEVKFNGPQSLEQVDVFTVQDSYATPAEPTLEMTFTRWGIQEFIVEYWTGSNWQPIPGGIVSGNSNVWRQFHFAPVTTPRIRVWITNGLASNSRLTEIEAHAVLGSENQPPDVVLSAPASGASFPVSSPIAIRSSATDADGTIARVDFYANGAAIGTDASGAAGTFETAWTPTIAGSYAITAVATDDRGAASESNAVTVIVTAPAGRTNVALAVNGGRAAVSSSYSSGYPAASLNNGDRRGINWGSGGGWADGTSNAWPDWAEIQFNGQQLIEQIDVFTVQDSYSTPTDPTPGMTFTKWGVRDFGLEYWNGSGWQPVPGAAVTGNTLVWQQFNFEPVSTSRIRVSIAHGLAANSRLTEIEAYAVLGAENAAPSVELTRPLSGAAFDVSTSVALEATAHDSDGTLARVDFYANGVVVGSDTTGVGGVYSFTWTPAVAGSYSVTAVATDDDGAARSTNPVTVTINPPPGRVNVALAANGGVASASSTYGSGYPASSLTNGDRRGAGWGSGGGWADGTSNVWPDWVQVEFSGARTIEQVDVFTVQDNYTKPAEPTLDMIFTKYGVRDFVVEYWTGSSWQPVPSGAVSDNTQVWRQINFAPVTTSRIRVLVTKGLWSNSRLTEIEVYASIGG